MKNWLKKIKRVSPSNFDRSSYLRLDKNERVIDYQKKFFQYIKKKINLFNISSYPNVYNTIKLISKKNSVSPNMVFLSAGSDISLKTCIELFTKKNDKIIILKPTFGMIGVYVNLYNLKSIEIGYDKNLNLDVSKLLKNINKKIKLIILANPNSPTGTIIKKELMRKILKKSNKLNVPIVIDEAYDGFYNYSYVKDIRRYKNLIVTKTFSKSFGLAGLRIGYTISNKKISNLLNKFRPMYEVNSIACLAAEYLLKNKSIEKKHIEEITKTKMFLKRELKKIGINYLDTYANFFHIEFGKKIKKIEKNFLKNNILFRKGPGVKGFEGYARFSLGSVAQMKKVLNIVKKKLWKK